MQTIRKGALATIGALVSLAVIAGIVLAGWQIGWWFQTQNANRQAHIIRNGYSNQQTLREQITQNIGNVLTITTQISQVGNGDQSTAAGLKAQRKAILSIVCQDADQIAGDPLPVDQAQFVQVNCTAGVVSPGSQYNS